MQQKTLQYTVWESNRNVFTNPLLKGSIQKRIFSPPRSLHMCLPPGFVPIALIYSLFISTYCWFSASAVLRTFSLSPPHTSAAVSVLFYFAAPSFPCLILFCVPFMFQHLIPMAEYHSLYTFSPYLWASPPHTHICLFLFLSHFPPPPPPSPLPRSFILSFKYATLYGFFA